MNLDYVEDNTLNEKGKKIQTEILEMLEGASKGSVKSPEEHNTLIEEAIKNVNKKKEINDESKKSIVDYLE